MTTIPTGKLTEWFDMLTDRVAYSYDRDPQRFWDGPCDHEALPALTHNAPSRVMDNHCTPTSSDGHAIPRTKKKNKPSPGNGPGPLCVLEARLVRVNSECTADACRSGQDDEG